MYWFAEIPSLLLVGPVTVRVSVLSLDSRRIDVATILRCVSRRVKSLARCSRTISGSSASESARTVRVVEKGARRAVRGASVGFARREACRATCRDSMMGYLDRRIGCEWIEGVQVECRWSLRDVRLTKRSDNASFDWLRRSELWGRARCVCHSFLFAAAVVVPRGQEHSVAFRTCLRFPGSLLLFQWLTTTAFPPTSATQNYRGEAQTSQRYYTDSNELSDASFDA